MNVIFNDEILEKLVNLMHSQLPLIDLMKFSDLQIRYQILELLENEEISQIVSSSEKNKWKKKSKFDIRHKETIKLFLKEYFVSPAT